MHLATDTEVAGDADSLDMGDAKPLGHHVYPARPFALISQAFGCQGYFDCEEDALPILRIKARAALALKSKFDFRLYRWDREQLVWFVAIKAVELGSGGVHA